MDRLHDPRAHDDLLNYRLLRLARLGGAPAVRLCEGRFGISRSEWRLIAALVEGGPMTSTSLARYARVEPGRVSRLLHRLLAKSLVERRTGRAGARSLLAATDDGARLHAELWPELAAINRRLMACLDAGEAECLDRCLAKLTAHAEAIRDAGGGVDARTDRRLGGSRRFWGADVD